MQPISARTRTRKKQLLAHLRRRQKLRSVALFCSAVLFFCFGALIVLDWNNYYNFYGLMSQCYDESQYVIAKDIAEDAKVIATPHDSCIKYSCYARIPREAYVPLQSSLLDSAAHSAIVGEVRTPNGYWMPIILNGQDIERSAQAYAGGTLSEDVYCYGSASYYPPLGIIGFFHSLSLRVLQFLIRLTHASSDVCMVTLSLSSILCAVILMLRLSVFSPLERRINQLESELNLPHMVTVYCHHSELDLTILSNPSAFDDSSERRESNEPSS